MKKRFFAALASLCVMMSALPMVAFAEEAPDSSTAITEVSALCEHHPSHDEACGYTEGTAEMPCGHEHTDECYAIAGQCVHTAHDESCGGLADPTVCTHVCGEDTGCVIKTLNCQHQHDESCGYVPATEGTPCAFVCEVCSAQDSGDTAAPSNAKPEECTCETLCTEEEVNADCPVCSAEGAELDKVCVGAAPMLPVTALAAGEATTVYVGGKTLTGSADSPAYATTDDSGNVSTADATAENYNIKWDGSTLTLDGAKIKGGTSSESLGATVGIYAFNNSGGVSLNIALKGVNEIFDSSHGIWVYSSSTGIASLTISSEDGSNLTASGTVNPGIQVQSNGDNAALTIQDAYVEAKVTRTSGDGVLVQAGPSSNASLTVDGGSLTATGMSEYGAGIRYTFGSSSSGSGKPSLTVSGNAMVKASGGEGGISTNSSTATEIKSDSEAASGGIVFNGNEGTVYGSVELQENLTIENGQTLTIPDGASLTIPDGATLTVNGGELTGKVNSQQPPQITTPPQSQTVTAGSPAAFFVTASAGGQLTYQWQQKTTESDSSWTDISGAATASYTIEATTTSMNGYQYRCVVTANGVSVISAPATLTVNELITYAITVHGSAGGTATADKTAAAAGETVTLTATPASGYHFDGWSVVSGTVAIQNNQFIMPAENVEIRAVFDRNSSSGGSSGGSSYRDREYDFWMDVKEQIRHADPGDTVKANARTYDRMPWSVMEALRNADNVTLHITWNGGEDIIIPSEAALTEQSRVYYPLSYLEDMTFEVESETPAADPDKVNPETGGILEVTAPAVTIPAGEPEVTDSRRGLAETPELAEEGIEQALPGVYQPEETVTTSTTEETGTSGLWIAGVVAVLAAAGGFWFWKRRSNS